MLKPITNELRSKIQTYIKNKLDISDLIKDVDIKGENLSFAIIKNLNRTDCDLSNTNFSHCILGDEKTIFSIIRCNISGCNFDGTIFVGKAWMRSCNATNCNFRNSDVSKVSYEHTDFMGSTFCDATIKIGTREGIGCKFPASLFEELTQGWDFKIKIEKK